MKVVAYYILLYGEDYLSSSIESIYNNVDEIICLYTPNPSHGHTTRLRCPDTREGLKREAHKFDPDNKVRWYEGKFKVEGDHRNHAIKLCKQNGADIIVVVDFDEIWYEDRLTLAIEDCYNNPVDDYRVRMGNLWRSFDYICYDPMRQRRLLSVEGINEMRYSDGEVDLIHTGYCRSLKDVFFKEKIHGHLGEWRDKWYDEKYKPFPPVMDTHPTNVGHWNPEKFDKTTLPPALLKHPFYNLPVIE